MPTNILLENDSIVRCLGAAISDGEAGLSQVPKLLKRVLSEDRWQKRIIPETGEIQTFTRFEEFVTTPPLEGLGATIELIKAICKGDNESLDLLDRVMQNPMGNTAGHNQYTDNSANLDNVNTSTPVNGNAVTYALRRLRTERPDLHERVLANDLTPHAAMVEAGFRERMIQVPHDVERAARILRRKFEPDDLARLARLLLE